MRRSILNRVANPTSNILMNLANALEKLLKKSSTSLACSSGHATNITILGDQMEVIDIDASVKASAQCVKRLLLDLKRPLKSFTSRIFQPPSMSLKLLKLLDVGWLTQHCLT